MTTAQIIEVAFAAALIVAAIVLYRRRGREVYFGEATVPAFLKSCGLMTTPALIVTIHDQPAIDARRLRFWTGSARSLPIGSLRPPTCLAVSFPVVMVVRRASDGPAGSAEGSRPARSEPSTLRPGIQTLVAQWLSTKTSAPISRRSVPSGSTISRCS